MSRAVTRAARLALPTSASTAALQAALWGGDDGQAAFLRWMDEVGDPRDLPAERRQAVREMGPQLEATRRSHGVTAPGALGLLLKLAADHERRRWGPYRDAAVDLLSAEVEPLVSGGLAIALTAYPEPALRHCHDIDRLGSAAAATTVHPSGLPGEVHPGLLPPVWDADEDLDAVRARAVPDERLGRPVLLASVGDLLVTVLVYGVAGRRPDSVRWASDAWLLARAATPSDWQVLTDTVARHRLGPVVAPALGYVSADLRGDVPAAVIEEVAAGPGPDGARADIALRWARPRRQQRLRAGRLPAGARAVRARLRR